MRIMLAIGVALVFGPAHWAEAEPAAPDALTTGTAEDREAILAEIAELRSRLNDLTKRLDAAPPPAPPAEDAEEDYPTVDWGGDALFQFESGFGESAVTPGFRLRRARFAASGRLREDTAFQVKAELVGGGDDIPRDVFIEHRASDQSTVRIGQFKMPQGYQHLLSRMDNLLAERSLISDGGAWNGRQIRRLSPERQIGAQYTYRDSHSTAQLAVFNGNGRNRRDENSALDVAGRYLYTSAGRRHEAGLSYHEGAQFDQRAPGNRLRTWGLEYRYNGRKNVVMVEALSGKARASDRLIPETGYSIEYVYWPDGSKPQAWWPSKGSGEEFYVARWEQAWANNDYRQRISLLWLGYGRYHSDDWRTSISVGLQRHEQRVYVQTALKF